MKIAIAGFGFTGATFPLAKHFSNLGYSVDLYYFVYLSRNRHIESFEYDDEHLFIGKITKVSNENNIYKYLSDNVNIYLIPIVPEKLNVLKAVNMLTIKRLAFVMRKRKYDFINILLFTEYDYHLYDELRFSTKVFCSAHEIYDSLNGSEKVIKKGIKKALSHDTHIVLHSSYLLNLLLDSYPDKSKLLHCIKFGKFESYHIFEGEDTMHLPDDYILFIGSIQPYKGLHLLYEASQQLSNNYRYVIAGKGNDSVLNDIKTDKKYILFNRFIENAEFVQLICGAKIIVCPYLEASQSGIVSCADLYKKPVVATNVGAFSELIEDNVTGKLCAPNDVCVLAESIQELMECEDKYESMRSNIDKKCDDWEDIVAEYEKLFKIIETV